MGIPSCDVLPTSGNQNGFPLLSRHNVQSSVRQSSESITPTYSPLLKCPPFGVQFEAMKVMARKLGTTTQKVYEALLAAEEMGGK